MGTKVKAKTKKTIMSESVIFQLISAVLLGVTVSSIVQYVPWFIGVVSGVLWAIASWKTIQNKNEENRLLKEKRRREQLEIQKLENE